MDKKLPNEDDTPHAEPDIERDGESFGAWLRGQREGREIELGEISQASKIGMTYLRAFEEERFDILPAPVFATGFLRQYARYVGLDPEEVVNFYLLSRREIGEEESPAPVAQPETSSGSNLGWMVFVGALLLFVIFWGFSRSSGKTSDPSESGAPAGRSEPSSSQPAAAESPMAEPEADRPGEPPVEGAMAAPPAAFPLRVVLDFAAECWVEARVDGKRQIAELKTQGESLLLEANEVVELKVGNIDAVQVEVNERPYVLEEPENGAVQNLRIDLAGVRRRAKAAGEG